MFTEEREHGKKNEEWAEAFLTVAVHQGNTAAAVLLGDLYADPDGALRDVRKAALYYEQAAESNNDLKALRCLGDLYSSADSGMLPKKIVSMGAYVCIWPDKKYFNTINTSDYGSMDRKLSISGENVSLALCRAAR